MKLATYTPQVNKNTIGNARVQVYDGGEAQALANIGNMQGKSLQGLAGTIQHVGEEMDAVNVQAASNEYTKRLNDLLYNQDNGLMNTKMQGAEGISQTFEEKERQIRQEVGSKYTFLSAKGTMTFNRMTENSAAQRYELVRRHQTQQYNAYRDLTFDNALLLNTQTAADNYSMPDVVEQNMREAIATTRMRYAGQGEEVLKAQERNAIASIAGQVIARAYANGDDDRAGAYIEKYGKSMSPEQITQYSKAVHQRVIANMTRNTADSLVAKYGDNKAALYNAIYKNGEGGSGYDGSVAVAWMKEQAKKGANWGVNTCTRGVNAAIEAGGALPGNLWAPTNWDEAKKSGIAFTNRSQLQSGDIVYWWKPGSDKDADDTSHVGIYDAESGKVYQSGTSGFKAINLDAYSITGFARPQGRGMTREQQDALYASCVRQINQQKAIRNAYNDEMYKNLDSQLMGLHDANNMDYNTYMAMVDQVAGNDPEMRRKGRTAADYWWNATVKNNKATQPALGMAEMDTVTNMIRDGQFNSESDMVAFMQKKGFKYEQIKKERQLWNDRLAGKGVFAYPNYSSYVDAAIQKTGDVQQDKTYKIWLNQFGIDFINSYREKNKGKNPSIQELQEALSKEYTDKKLMLRSPDGQEVFFTPIELTPKGIVSVDVATYTDPDDPTKQKEMPGMVKVKYRGDNGYGKVGEVYMPFNQFVQEIGKDAGGNGWFGMFNSDYEPDTLSSGS